MLFYNISKFLDHPYRDDLTVKISFISGLAANIFTWLILYYKLSPFAYLTQAGQVYLHYNIYFGIDNIGSWYMALVIPLLGLLILVVNNILAYFFYIRDKVLSRILVLCAAFLQLVLLVASVFVILLNI